MKCKLAVAVIALGVFGLSNSEEASAADDLSQPIGVSTDGHFLTQSDGKPFFWLGDWGWELFKKPDRDEVDRYLQDRSSKGFTVIVAPVTGMFDALVTPNRYKEIPFLDNDPTRPNPRYFEHADWIIQRAAHYGLRMALLPSWGNLVNDGWFGKGAVFTADTAEHYGRWLGARYRDKGISWVLGGDTNPLWPKTTATDQLGAVRNESAKADRIIGDSTPIYDAFARGILAGSGGHAFITYHPSGGSWPGTPQPRTSLYFADRPWLQMNMIQSGHHLIPAPIVQASGLDFVWKASFNYQPIRDEYNSTPTRPVIDGEPRYEDIAINLDPANGYWKAYDMRNAAYHALFAGAAGHNYGNESLGLFYDPIHGPRLEIEMRPWQQALHATGSGQMQHAKNLLLSRPYFTRIPDQSVIVGDAGEGEPHIAATRDKNGSFAMIYLPHGQNITVDLSKISGTRALAWWFDPSTGVSTRVPGEFPTSGTQRFSPPTSGADVDWVLVLDDKARKFKAPGTST